MFLFRYAAVARRTARLVGRAAASALHPRCVQKTCARCALGHSRAALVAVAQAAGWQLALRSRVNDDTFLYWSSVWEDGVPFNTDAEIDDKNALFPTFNTVYVEKIKIKMNDVEIELVMP